MWARFGSDPTTRAFFQQGNFKNKMLDVQENPSTLNRHLKDPRIVEALGVLLNVKLRRPNSAEDVDIPDVEMTEEEPEPEEEREARERKKEAHKEKEKGNATYKKDFEAAIQHYAKAIDLDDKDISFLTHRAVVYLEMGQAYRNRAACYIKLGAMSEGLKDAEKCIELDLSFAKGYSRKGTIQFFMKKYDKALEMYQEGLKHEPRNQELLDGVRSSKSQISLQVKAIQNPEIQSILMDPVMSQVLIDFDENPKAALEHAKNPGVMNKIQKLVSAGIVQMK
ncbi:hsp70-Hsp90 organizing protein 1-like [Actinidia eriantha]|uniref:hsp70-Hsp90 organizing protein 1-like n=1 Tax=Actinidia eriantha TaxID=165200 RepID=UPI00258BE042|nr:hsp70-Hsp90 organizing protein 1-like [Actinidia eriantha]